MDKTNEKLFYVVLLPSEENPLVKSLDEITRKRPNGALPPKNFALVPLIIRLIKTGDNPVSPERIRRLLELKIDASISTSIERLMTNVRQVEKWVDVVVGAKYQLIKPGTAFINFEYGDASRGLFEIMTSELITGTFDWERRYGYRVDVERTKLDIMIIANCPGEMVLTSFSQKILETEVSISARKWTMGLSVDKEYVWKRAWEEVIRPITYQ